MSGSFAEQARRRIEKEKENKNSKDRLADKFNETAMLLIDEFMNEVVSGNIRVDDTADLMRLFQIYHDINEIQSGVGEGSGSLPELSQRQSKHLKTYLETTEVETPEGVHEDIVDPESLMNMSEEDVQEMIKEREIEMNQDNADEWEEGVVG